MTASDNKSIMNKIYGINNGDWWMMAVFWHRSYCFAEDWQSHVLGETSFRPAEDPSAEIPKADS
jgi:hypothetical protein